MGQRYGVIGARRQDGVAAVDFARFGDADEIIRADVDGEVAGAAAQCSNRLAGREVAAARPLDGLDRESVTAFMHGLTACVAGVHFTFNLEATRSATEAGVHLCDFGGNTSVEKNQLKLHEAARLSSPPGAVDSAVDVRRDVGAT